MIFIVTELFDVEHIRIAFPQQDVHLGGNITLLNQQHADRMDH